MRKDEKNNSMNDSELEALVAKLAPKKTANLDQNFKRGLNFRLHSEISRLNQKQTKQLFNFNSMKTFNYILAGGVAVAIVALIFVSLPDKKNNVLLPGKQQITKVNDKAFGSLATLALATAKGGMGGGGNAAVPLGTPEAMSSTSAVAPSGAGVSSDAKLFVPTNYKFVYKGDDFTIDSEKMPVYEREKGFGSNVSLSSLLGNFNIGSFNVNKFSNANLDYITASQNVDLGYTLSLDLREGNIYIGQNWEKWQSAVPACQDQACFDANRITIDQVPADDQIIQIANQFLDEYGIDRSVYGEPYVQDYWRTDYLAASDKASYYIPEAMSVVFPTKIEGNEIYDQGGNKSGMYVTVDIRSNKVTGVGELTSQLYQSSNYETETDAKRILGVAEKGGYQSYYPIYDDANSKTTEVDLGNPVSGYVRLWLTKDGATKDLFVPSLIFPVTNPGQGIYVKNVIVPVIKDVLDSQNDSVPPIRILDKAAM